MSDKLKGKNIFDIATSPEAACEALDISTTTRAQYLAAVAPEQVPVDMLIYAEKTGNTELAKEINSTFEEELFLLFNE